MKKRLCSVVLTAAMVIGLVSPAYGAALPETSVPETTQETVSSGDSAGADSGEALPEEAEEVTEAPAEEAEAVVEEIRRRQEIQSGELKSKSPDYLKKLGIMSQEELKQKKEESI